MGVIRTPAHLACMPWESRLYILNRGSSYVRANMGTCPRPEGFARVPCLKEPGHEPQYAEAGSGLEAGWQYAGPVLPFGL